MEQRLSIACFAIDGCRQLIEKYIAAKDASMMRIWNEDESATKHSLKKLVLYAGINLRQDEKTLFIVQMLVNKFHIEKRIKKVWKFFHNR